MPGHALQQRVVFADDIPVAAGVGGNDRLAAGHIFHHDQIGAALTPIREHANIGFLVGISLLDQQNTMDRIQASLFVDVYRHSGDTQLWKGKAMITELKSLLTRFIGPRQTDTAFATYFKAHNIDFSKDMQADAELVEFAERLLSGAIGAASARVMVGGSTLRASSTEASRRR